VADIARRRRKVQPKFFLFLAIVALLVAGVIFVASKLGEEKEASPEIDASVAMPTAAPNLSDPGAVATPAPPLADGLSVRPSGDANPSLFGFSYSIGSGSNEISSYSREIPISFGHADTYAQAEGILTFGGNNYRNAFSFGTAAISEKMLRRTWEQTVGSIGSWSGTGWTGQPLIVKWPDEVRSLLGVSEEFKQKAGFTEVIYAAMDGKIYFFELETGAKTRTPIDTGVVLKSTPCLDPRGWPVLYVGQSIQTTNDHNLNVAYIYAYSLITNEELTRFGGHDYFSERQWQAYDGSPLIVDDTIIYGGENGVLYTAKLNTSFDPAAGTVSLDPERLVKYRYSGSGYSKDDAVGSRWYGIESSVAGFQNYVYFTDNGGRLQCVDLNSLSLQFVADMSEDADATVVIDENFSANTIQLYASSQVKNPSIDGTYGYSYHRCFDGLTGALKWEQKWICSTGDENSSGGTNATAQVGRGNVSNLVFFAMNHAALNSASAPNYGDGSTAASYAIGGRIVAYNKHTGDIAWMVEQTADYWSSPVLIYDETGKGYLVQCDRAGQMKLYDAYTGSELFSVDLGSRIDSTPAAFGNYLVVGTRGKGGAGESAKIICVKIN